MSVATFIGWRYLKAKKKQSVISLTAFFSLMGVALGVASLIVVLAVINGTEEEVKNRLLTINSHIMLVRYGQTMADYPQMAEKVKAQAGVRSADPFIYTQAMFQGAGGVGLGVLRGLDLGTETGEASYLAPLVKPGSLLDLKPAGQDQANEVPGAVIGYDLAKHLKAKPGSLIKIISPTGSISENGLRSPRSGTFRVVGIFQTGMYDYDSAMAYIELGEAQKFLNYGKTVTGLDIRVKDVYEAGTVRQKLVDALGPGYWARDWMQMNQNMFAALKLQKVVMFIILSLTVVVAALNIVSTLVMMVMDKTREVAILRAMGAGRSTIMKIFVFQGFLLGVLGTSVGLMMGLGVCQLLKHYQFIELPTDVYYISTMPVDLKPLEAGAVIVCSLVVCLAATLYPAWQAVRLGPVEALRYE